MKRILSILFLTLIFFSSYGQISIKDYGGLDLTNSTADLPSDLDYHFEITNEGSSEISFIVEVTAFSIPEDANGISVCTGDICLPITNVPRIVGSPTPLAAGDTYGEEENLTEELLDVNYSSNESSGAASITINVYEEGNETNFAEFTLSKESSSIFETNQNDGIVVFPNPAKSYTNIKVPYSLIGGKIVLTNILGKTVLSQNIDKPKTRLSTKELSSGMYLYSVFKDGQKRSTKKIIVN